MKVIIQCSARKKGAHTFKTQRGEEPLFVAQPQLCPKVDQLIFARPDDPIPDQPATTWRSLLTDYNSRYAQDGSNPFGLLPAGGLYVPEIYGSLVARFGWINTFILSAGWGLVRADFLLPYYDITFSAAQNVEAWKRRHPGDSYDDYNHLSDRLDRDDSLYFFGGRDYLPLLYRLTRHLPIKKIIYYISQSTPRTEGYSYIRYPNPKNCMTNWHYECASDFLLGSVPM